LVDYRTSADLLQVFGPEIASPTGTAVFTWQVPNDITGNVWVMMVSGTIEPDASGHVTEEASVPAGFDVS
jgi:hypothetical protein